MRQYIGQLDQYRSKPQLRLMTSMSLRKEPLLTIKLVFSSFYESRIRILKIQEAEGSFG